MPSTTVFTNLHRTAKLKEAAETEYDLVIIGGGITGAGILLDAALRGLKVLLIEKNDFASGTSSKSTKLIHGGLRYLKQLEIGLVRETGQERAVAHNNACHLVHPENMVLPIVKNGTFGQVAANLAIYVYDFLAGVQGEQRKRRVNKAQLQKLEPTFKSDILKAGVVYSEYRTDDARLTIEIIKAGIRNKGIAFNYLEAVDFVKDDNTIRGVICKDILTNDTTIFKSKVVVNAAGPWVDKIRKQDDINTEIFMFHSKGVHLVFNKKSLPITNAVYFDAFDGRMLFAIPRGEIIYVGTTDTVFKGNPDQLQCAQEDADYIINATNAFFDIKPLKLADVQSSWTGIRPLVKQAGKGQTEMSRKDEIYISDSNLITIAGGKLTGFRKMALRVVDIVIDKLPQDYKPCSTEHYKIHHQAFDNYQAYNQWNQQLVNDFEAHFSREDIIELSNNFGHDAKSILETAIKDLNNKLILAQLNFCVQHEAIYDALDFFERRTGWLYFNINKVRESYKFVIQELSVSLSLTEKQTLEMTKRCESAIALCSLAHLKNN